MTRSLWIRVGVTRLILLARTVDLFISGYTLIIFVRVIMSWIRPQGYSPVYHRLGTIVYAITEPLLGPMRRALPSTGGIDFSPILALILLSMLRNAAWRFLTQTLVF